ncbi:MAG: hypothetical protein WBG69_06980 [Arcobacteraceae bacterium]
MEFALLIIVFFVVLFFIVSKKSYKIKNSAIKKEEIIQQYENDLKNILSQYTDDKTKQIEEKKIFLQNCNSELSRNIFFTQEESLQILQRLSKL